MPTVDATIIECIANPALWQPWFRNPESWQRWLVFLRAMFGLSMNYGQQRIFQKFTGRTTPNPNGYKEAWLCVGRRGGKSLMMATIAVYLAVFRDWSEFTVPGESALIQVLAVDRRQARIVYRYAKAMLTMVPVLKQLVIKEQDELLQLNNGISIEITTNSFRGVRGYTIVAALLDEVAYWRSDDSTNPDSETLVAMRPAMATVPGAILIGASSPYAKRGVLYDAYREHYGKDSNVLVWKATTREMNPSFPQRLVDDAMEKDPSSAGAEYMATFRDDLESFVSKELIDQLTVPGRLELLPARYGYRAFVDPSGGSADAMTMAIGHSDNGMAILDVLIEHKPPFSSAAVVADLATHLRRYKIGSCEGDRYAGNWVAESFRQHGITYVPSERSKSQIYNEALPLLNARKVELLDNRKLAAQLVSLERRTIRGGTRGDSVDHPPGAHDDLANAACGALVLVGGARSTLDVWMRLIGKTPETATFKPFAYN